MFGWKPPSQRLSAPSIESEEKGIKWSENDCGPAGGPMLMNRWCGRGKVKPVRVGVSGTPCCVDRCADVRFSSPACSAKAVACVQNALIYPSLFFVIFGPAHGQPNCLSRRKITFFCSLSHLFFSGRIAEQCFRILRDTWLAVTMV